MGRCSCCSNQYHQIPSDGPDNARIAVFAERPGQWEEANARNGYTGYYDREGKELRCLVGPTGKEWNDLYLPLAGIDRSEVYVGNVVQCGADNNRKPSAKEVMVCARNHVSRELIEVQPEVVVLMGSSACSLIPGGVDLEVEHGVPRRGRIFDWEGWVVPMFHPALGLHDGSKMSWLLDDWRKFGEWWEIYNAEEQGICNDGGPYPAVRSSKGAGERRDYALIETPRDLEAYATATVSFSNPPWPLIGIDTESHGPEQFSIQFSTEVGTGRIILLKDGDPGTIEAFIRWINQAIRSGAVVIFHNHPADIADVESLGVKVGEFRDTMQEAYHLGLPQGLKALSYRLLGRKRMSWEETVTPPSKLRVVEWLVRASEITEGWRDEIQRVGKRGQPLKPKLVKSKMEGVIKSILTHTITSETYDPWKKIVERASGMEFEVLEDSLGPVPLRGVAHLELAELVEYGCSDADDTLAVALEFERMRGEFHTKINVTAEDRDYVARKQEQETRESSREFGRAGGVCV